MDKLQFEISTTAGLTEIQAYIDKLKALGDEVAKVNRQATSSVAGGGGSSSSSGPRNYGQELADSKVGVKNLSKAAVAKTLGLDPSFIDEALKEFGKNFKAELGKVFNATTQQFSSYNAAGRVLGGYKPGSGPTVGGAGVRASVDGMIDIVIPASKFRVTVDGTIAGGAGGGIPGEVGKKVKEAKSKTQNIESTADTIRRKDYLNAKGETTRTVLTELDDLDRLVSTSFKGGKATGSVVTDDIQKKTQADLKGRLADASSGIRANMAGAFGSEAKSKAFFQAASQLESVDLSGAPELEAQVKRTAEVFRSKGQFHQQKFVAATDKAFVEGRLKAVQDNLAAATGGDFTARRTALDAARAEAAKLSGTTATGLTGGFAETNKAARNAAADKLNRLAAETDKGWTDSVRTEAERRKKAEQKSGDSLNRQRTAALEGNRAREEAEKEAQSKASDSLNRQRNAAQQKLRDEAARAYKKTMDERDRAASSAYKNSGAGLWERITGTPGGGRPASMGAPAPGMFSGISMLGNAAKVTSWMIPAFAAVEAFKAVSAVVSRAAEKTIELNLQQARLGQVFRGTSAEAEMLGKNVQSLATANGRSVNEGMEAAISFSRLGLDRKEVNEGVRVSLMASNVAELSAADATERLVGVMTVYKASVWELNGMLGMLNNTSNKSKVTNADLLDGLAKAAPVAKQAGVGFAELQGLIAGVVASGNTGAQAGNAVKTIFTRLGDPTTQAALRERFGIETLSAKGGLKDGSEILRETFVKYQGMDQRQRGALTATVFGATQASRGTALLESYVAAQERAIDAQLNLNSAELENVRIKQTLKAEIEGLKSAWDQFITGTMNRGGEGSATRSLTELTRSGKNLLRLDGKFSDSNGMGVGLGDAISPINIPIRIGMANLNRAAGMFNRGAETIIDGAEPSQRRDLERRRQDAQRTADAYSMRADLMQTLQQGIQSAKEGGQTQNIPGLQSQLDAVVRSAGGDGKLEKLRAEADALRSERDTLVGKTWTSDSAIFDGEVGLKKPFQDQVGDANAALLAKEKEVQAEVARSRAASGPEGAIASDRERAAAGYAAAAKVNGEIADSIQRQMDGLKGVANSELESLKLARQRSEVLARQGEMVRKMELSKNGVFFNEQAEGALASAARANVGAIGNFGTRGLDGSARAALESAQLMSQALLDRQLADSLKQLPGLSANQATLNKLGLQLTQSADTKAAQASDLDNPIRRAQMDWRAGMDFYSRRAGFDIANMGVGATEAERLLDQKGRLEKEAPELRHKAGYDLATDNERARLLEVENGLARNQESIQERIVKLRHEEKQIIEETNRQQQRALLFSGPGEMLQRLAVKGLDPKNMSAGQFFSLDAGLRKQLDDQNGGEAMSRSRREQGALAGMELSPEDAFAAHKEAQERIKEAGIGIQESFALITTNAYGLAESMKYLQEKIESVRPRETFLQPDAVSTSKVVDGNTLGE